MLLGLFIRLLLITRLHIIGGLLEKLCSSVIIGASWLSYIMSAKLNMSYKCSSCCEQVDEG